MDKDLHKAETNTDMDAVIRRWQYSIRGLHEVRTDDMGREMIAKARDDMRAMYRHMRDVIADLEWRNLELNMALRRQDHGEMMRYIIHLKDREIEHSAEVIEELTELIRYGKKNKTH